jgi:FAD/FMN-containing dehydrogenase
MPATPTSETIERLTRAVGNPYALRDPASMAPYLSEPRNRWHGRAALVVRPATTEEVAKILAIASDTRTAIVTQGGNTGLVGGQVPRKEGDEVVMSLARLNRIRDTDAVNNTMTVEAGCTLAAVQEAAARVGRFFPLSLASEGSCSIGGNLATNAGGAAVIAYGSARALTLGLEVVLADGRIWHGLGRLRKDNTGYNLKDIFIGSEGTLGVITAAVLALHPEPTDWSVAWAAVAGPEQALELMGLAAELSGHRVTSIELVPRIGLEFAVKHASVRDPLAGAAPWYVLLELSAAQEHGTLAPVMEAILAKALERGIVRDGVIAGSLTQRGELRAIREALPVVQKHEGHSIKHDVSVPRSELVRFLAEASKAVVEIVPGSRPVPFGHIGDGNVHFNVSQPEGMRPADFAARTEEINEAVYAVVAACSGSISAEHGIGQHKRERMSRVKSAVELDLMKGLKRLLDPLGILNPGKVLPDG